MADALYDTLSADDPLGFVRSLIPDMEQLADPEGGDPSYLFDDATLRRYLAMAKKNSPKRAAADACIALAGSENLILKKITTEDLMTDGPNVAREHRLRAAQLRSDADADDKDEDGNVGSFSVPYLKNPVPFDAMRHVGGRRW